MIPAAFTPGHRLDGHPSCRLPIPYAVCRPPSAVCRLLSAPGPIRTADQRLGNAGLSNLQSGARARKIARLLGNARKAPVFSPVISALGSSFPVATHESSMIRPGFDDELGHSNASAQHSLYFARSGAAWHQASTPEERGSYVAASGTRTGNGTDFASGRVSRYCTHPERVADKGVKDTRLPRETRDGAHHLQVTAQHRITFSHRDPHPTRTPRNEAPKLGDGCDLRSINFPPRPGTPTLTISETRVPVAVRAGDVELR